MIAKLHSIGICFIFGTKFSWNEGIDTCFNVKYVLLGRNFDILDGYCLLRSGYCWLLIVTWWLLVVTAHSQFLYESIDYFFIAASKNITIEIPKIKTDQEQTQTRMSVKNKNIQLQHNLLVLIKRIVYDQGFGMILTKVVDLL